MTIRNNILAALFVAAMITPTVSHANTKYTDKQQIECLAESVYYEAGGESKAGKIAVGHVVMNRVKSKQYPKTTCDVVRQKSKGQCQFTWACDNITKSKNKVLYAQSFEIAEMVFLEDVSDNTFGALYFHSRHIKPRWTYKLNQTVKIGNHIFYKG